MIPRTLQNEIIQLLEHFPVVGILGSRQVGKTTLAKTIAKAISKPTIYLDLELPSDNVKLANAESFLAEQQDQCVIIDEIQRQPELFPILRALIDQNRIPGRFLILGSASPLLIRNASESLAGRVSYRELSPFNLTELKLDTDTMKHHWFWGGFPNVYQQNKANMAKEWMHSYIENYIYRDLPDLGMPAAPDVTKRLLSMLAHLHGQLLNKEQLSKSLGVDRRTVDRYLNVLNEAFLIEHIPPYYHNIKKRLVKSPKLYFRDSGMLHHLLNINTQDDLYGAPQLGFSFEGYVIEQIRQLLPKNYSLYFYRTHDGAEIDALILKGDTPFISLEVKYSDAPKVPRGFMESIETLKTPHNFVITPYSDSYAANDTVNICNLCDFLKTLSTLINP